MEPRASVHWSLVATTVLVIALHAEVWAACNTIPEAPQKWLGFRGSIDRPFVRAGVGDVLTLHLSTASGSPKLPDVNRDGAIDQRDLTFTLLFKPTDGLAHQIWIAGDDDCGALVAEPSCLERLFCHDEPTCLAASDLQLQAVATASEGQIRFRYPDTKVAGPLTLVVTRAGTSAPPAVQKLSCSQVASADLLACIDELREDETARIGSREGAGSHPASSFRQLMALPAPNNFQEVCERDVGDTPRCKGASSPVHFTVDQSGDVFVAMHWGKILRPKQGLQGLDRRQVRASSAVAPFEDSTGRIHIPSAAFLDSFSPFGTGFLDRPLFVPQDLPNRPNEVTLFGTADQADSVLRIARRRLWENVCSGGSNVGQACEPVPMDHLDLVDCPEASCVVQPPPRYFNCAGGSRDGLPCTRPFHCPAGQCTAATTCQQSAGTSTGQPCHTDADCGPGEECGRSLFDFRSRVKNGVGTLKRKSTGDGAVCASGINEGAPCTSWLQCYEPPFGFPNCVAYRAEAGVYVSAP